MQKINLVMINKYHGQTVWTFEDMMLSLLQLLLNAGFDTKITANHLDPEAVNILFGVGSVFSHSFAELEQFAAKHSTIIFNGEQVDSSSVLITQEYLEFLSHYVVMDWCQPNIDAIIRRVPQARQFFEMPIFPTPNLTVANAPEWGIKYDLGFYGALPPRRQKLIDDLEREDISIKHISNFFGNALNNQLLDCRYILNMHAYETDLLEINRCLRPMAMGIPLISEASTLPASGDWDDSGIQFAPTEGFGRAVKRILSDPDNHVVASRKAIQFVSRRSNAVKVKAVMDSAIAALAAMRPNA